MDNEKNEKKRFRSVEKEVVKEVIQNDDGTETVIYGTEIVEEEVPDTRRPRCFRGGQSVGRTTGRLLPIWILQDAPSTENAGIPTK